MDTPPPHQLTHAHALRILDSIAAGVFTVDRDLRVRYFNRTAEKITGITATEAIGHCCSEVVRCGDCATQCALKRAMDTGKETVHKRCSIHLPGGRTIPISITAAALRDDGGAVVGGVESFRDLSAIVALQKELRRSYTFEDIVSKNHLMQKLFDILPDIANSGSTVLLQGPSGSGKELFARAIHNLSARKSMPLVAVNCGAVPDTLLESELFGYMRGAFTDARGDKPGRFEVARGGTLFLDEVESLSQVTQVKLLRVLQEREYTPLGATAPVKADVRIVAATKEDLAALVAAGTFRDDLYFRLNVVRLELPRLADRREDIPLLVECFIDKLNRKMVRVVRSVSPEVMHVLMRHDFPGNVRQLENIIEHAFVMCRGEQIELAHLPPDLFASIPAAGRVDFLGEPLDMAQREVILAMLTRYRWDKSRTARELGISRTTLWRKCQRYGLKPPIVSSM
jgi:PAS domain S-box-containing protein